MSSPDRSASLRRVLFQVHLWMGVTAALYVLVVSVTGAALVFRIHLQRAVHPELLTAGTDGPQADIVTVLESVREAYPRGRLSGVDAPTAVRPTHLAYVTENGRFHTVLSDPVTAEVLGELPSTRCAHAAGPALRPARRRHGSGSQRRGRALSSSSLHDRPVHLVAGLGRMAGAPWSSDWRGRGGGRPGSCTAPWASGRSSSRPGGPSPGPTSCSPPSSARRSIGSRL